jgi:hypothetical protein
LVGSVKLELQYAIVLEVRNEVVPPSVVNFGVAVASNCSAVYVLEVVVASGCDGGFTVLSEHATARRAVAATAIVVSG